MSLLITHLPQMSTTVVRIVCHDRINPFSNFLQALKIFQSFSFFLMFICPMFVWLHISDWAMLSFPNSCRCRSFTHMHESPLICIDLDRKHGIEINLLCMRFLYTGGSQVSDSILPVAVSYDWMNFWLEVQTCHNYLRRSSETLESSVLQKM